MKRYWMTLILAAVCTTSAAVAGEMTATIPFDFTANGKHMTAGTYTFNQITGAGNFYMLKVTNKGTRNSTGIVSNYNVRADSPERASVTFRCSSSGCALAQLQSPWDSAAHAFPTPSKRGEKERTVAIRLEPATAAHGS